jgi:signal transduction histidine kinase
MIEDDGKGFNPKTILSKTKTRKGHGNGLGNMKNRSEMLNGEILIESTIDKGTTITVDFPMNKVSE